MHKSDQKAVKTDGENIKKVSRSPASRTLNELRAKYADVFGEETNARHKEWLVRRIA